MRRPSPIKISEESDERIQIRGEEVEIFDILIDAERAEKLARWLFRASKYLKGEDGPEIPE